MVAGATLGDNSPAPDGVPGRLTWRNGTGAPQPLSQATTANGGRLQFNGELPPEAAGQQVELTACVDQIGGGTPNCTTQEVLIDAPPVDNDKDGVSPPADCDDSSASVRPGLPERIDNSIDEDCNGVVTRRVRFQSRVSLARTGSRYTGRVTSSAPKSAAFAGCASRRTVKLRRAGSGTKSFGSTVADTRGRFSLRRPARVRGRFYVVVVSKTVGLNICTSSTSRTIRG